MTDAAPESPPDSVASLLSAWTRAEQAGDADRLDGLLTADFCAVGPLGFVLPREAWIGRHRAGDLSYEIFALDDQQTRQFGDVAVITARNTTTGSYRGDPIPEAMRVTLIAASSAVGWRLAHVHMSFIAGAAGAPPISGSNQ